MSQEPGDVSRALREGYRVAVHDRFFPFESRAKPGTMVHAVVDHGARAVFCSREFFDALPKVEA